MLFIDNDFFLLTEVASTAASRLNGLIKNINYVRFATIKPLAPKTVIFVAAVLAFPQIHVIHVYQLSMLVPHMRFWVSNFSIYSNGGKVR